MFVAPRDRTALAKLRYLLAGLVSLLGLQGVGLALTGRTLLWAEDGPGWVGGAALGGQVLAIAAVALLVWRVVLVVRYRPCPGLADDVLPYVTVVVPAYNEGAQVYRTLASLMASDFPADKLYVVAVDDGSSDDTWRHMSRAQRQWPARILAVRCEQNRGKRAALHEGFRRARGEVLVTVDSDSEVLPDTLRNLISPFAADERVGAVAGNVRVLNGGGALAAMLDVTYTFAFEFMRASESEVDTVMCCPGALAAYRRRVVDEVLDAWMAQTFLGHPANIGEDRSMTNFILRAGYLTRFQANAIVLTEVPETLPRLARMFLRWARSNVRETLILASFIFTRFRSSGALGARVNLVASAARLLMAGLTFVPGILLVVARPSVIPLVAVGLVAAASFRVAVFACTRGARQSLWAIPYAFLAATTLSWITPYALLTPHQSAWLTRGAPRDDSRRLGNAEPVPSA